MCTHLSGGRVFWRLAYRYPAGRQKVLTFDEETEAGSWEGVPSGRGRAALPMIAKLEAAEPPGAAHAVLTMRRR